MEWFLLLTHRVYMIESPGPQKSLLLPGDQASAPVYYNLWLLLKHIRVLVSRDQLVRRVDVITRIIDLDHKEEV